MIMLFISKCIRRQVLARLALCNSTDTWIVLWGSVSSQNCCKRFGFKEKVEKMLQAVVLHSMYRLSQVKRLCVSVCPFQSPLYTDVVFPRSSDFFTFSLQLSLNAASCSLFHCVIVVLVVLQERNSLLFQFFTIFFSSKQTLLMLMWIKLGFAVSPWFYHDLYSLHILQFSCIQCTGVVNNVILIIADKSMLQHSWKVFQWKPSGNLA